MTPKILVNKILRRVKRILRFKKDFLEKNKEKKIRQCYICGEQFEKFYPYRSDNKIESAARFFKMTGSDGDNFGCYYCNCSDRERHLFMFFDKLLLWQKFKEAKILHFAPEHYLSIKISSYNPKEYIKGDLFPRNDWSKVDITDIRYSDNYFDIIIGNHILEHVWEHRKAIDEIARVLKPGGFAILQTPYSELLHKHFEDPGIDTDQLRLVFYGQEDHVKIVAKRELFKELSQKLKVNLVLNKSLFSEEECFRFGVNKNEDLLMVIKE